MTRWDIVRKQIRLMSALSAYLNDFVFLIHVLIMDDYIYLPQNKTYCICYIENVQVVSLPNDSAVPTSRCGNMNNAIIKDMYWEQRTSILFV